MKTWKHINSDANLINSRKGIDLDSDEFKTVYGEDLFYKLFDVVNDERKLVHYNHW